MKLKEDFREFITVYDENDNEITMFQSYEIDELKNSICKLLDYLKVNYEYNSK